MPRRHRQLGFTIVELITVVTIIGVLAAIAIPSFMRWKRQGYKAEAQTFLGKAALMQEQYRSEFGFYLSCPSNQQNWPALLSGGEPTKKDVASNACWQALGLQTQGGTGSTVETQLACSYSIYGGPASAWGPDPQQTSPAGGSALPSVYQGTLGASAPLAKWYVLIGECDLDAHADGTGNNSLFLRNSLTASLGEVNPGK